MESPKESGAREKKALPARPCAYQPCGREFVPRRPHALYCRTACRMAAHGRNSKWVKP